MTFDLIVNFNAIGFDRLGTALLGSAHNPSGIRKGERLTVGDGEGNGCRANVLARDDVLVSLEIDPETFRGV